ncbi:MAG: hypothetical protein EBS92_06275, partial [Proteobacteria bacterium]|nr:hypothetical protein [Pseudomonadota bacterium]
KHGEGCGYHEPKQHTHILFEPNMGIKEIKQAINHIRKYNGKYLGQGDYPIKLENNVFTIQKKKNLPFKLSELQLLNGFSIHDCNNKASIHISQVDFAPALIEGEDFKWDGHTVYSDTPRVNKNPWLFETIVIENGVIFNF